MPSKKKATRVAATSKPADAAVVRATRQALGKLRAEHAKLSTSVREDLVAEAHAYCLANWDGSRPYEAFVTWKANNLALDHHEKEKRRNEAIEVSRAARPATITALRAAVMKECRRRVLQAMGGDETWFADFIAKRVNDRVTEHEAISKAAKRVLRALRGAPESVVSRVDVTAMTQYACLYGAPLRHVMGVVGFMYPDAHRRYHAFGGLTGTDTERAVLAILCGDWPTAARAGITVSRVIELEAEHIRKARPKPEK